MCVEAIPQKNEPCKRLDMSHCFFHRLWWSKTRKAKRLKLGIVMEAIVFTAFMCKTRTLNTLSWFDFTVGSQWDTHHMIEPWGKWWWMRDSSHIVYKQKQNTLCFHFLEDNLLWVQLWNERLLLESCVILVTFNHEHNQPVNISIWKWLINY